MEIWHVDQILLFQKASSMVFGALTDILLSVPAFHLLFASHGTWGDALPSPPAGDWGCAQHGAGMQTQQHLPFPHLPSWKLNPSFCASHLQAGGSCCLGLALCCAALSAHGAAASLGGSVVCRDGWFAVAAEHQVWQLDRLPGHLSLPQSSAGVPAGFLKCKLQLQCETHPFALLFFSSLLPV